MKPRNKNKRKKDFTINEQNTNYYKYFRIDIQYATTDRASKRNI